MNSLKSAKSNIDLKDTVSEVMERSETINVPSGSGLLAQSTGMRRDSIDPKNNKYNRERNNSLFNISVLSGISNMKGKRETFSIRIHFDSGFMYVGNHRVKISEIFRVQTKGATELILYLQSISTEKVQSSLEIQSPLHIDLENSGQRRELCIYIRLFCPDAQFIDVSEITRDGGIILFKAIAPLGMMQRHHPCLFIIDSQVLTVTFVPGEDEYSNRAQCFSIDKSTQMVQKKKRIIIAFSPNVEPVTAIFKSSYQCLRFASWIHRLRHMAAIKLKKKVLGPPPPQRIFDSGETYDIALDVWCGTWNVGEALLE
jgi:hypothetical protein